MSPAVMRFHKEKDNLIVMWLCHRQTKSQKKKKKKCFQGSTSSEGMN